MLWRRLLDGWVLCGFNDTYLDIRSQYSILDSCSTRQSRFPSLLLYQSGVRTLELFLSLSMITDVKSALEPGHFVPNAQRPHGSFR